VVADPPGKTLLARNIPNSIAKTAGEALELYHAEMSCNAHSRTVPRRMQRVRGVSRAIIELSR
jgi:hypothetical protein